MQNSQPVAQGTLFKVKTKSSLCSRCWAGLRRGERSVCVPGRGAQDAELKHLRSLTNSVDASSQHVPSS